MLLSIHIDGIHVVFRIAVGRPTHNRTFRHPFIPQREEIDEQKGISCAMKRYEPLHRQGSVQGRRVMLAKALHVKDVLCGCSGDECG